MFALVAFVCFILALFKVAIGTVDLTILGFCFIALHLLWTVPLPMPAWRRTPGS
jgi:hypothetical protein